MGLLPVLWIFNVHTDINACNCTRRLYGSCKSLPATAWMLLQQGCISVLNKSSSSSVLKADREKNTFLHQWLESVSAALWIWRSPNWATSRLLLMTFSAMFLLSTVTLRVLCCLGRWSSAQNCVFLVDSDADNLVLFGQVEFSTKLCFSCPQWCW